MNRVFKAFFAVLVLILQLSGIHAQASVLASGGDAAGEGGTVAYSVGQVSYINFQSLAGSVSQGVQQAYLSIMVSNEESGPIFQAGLYPNPVQAELQLNLTSKTPLDFNLYTFSLCDLSGREIMKGKIEGERTNIVITDISDGVYFLVISQETRPFRTFKVIKTN